VYAIQREATGRWPGEGHGRPSRGTPPDEEEEEGMDWRDERSIRYGVILRSDDSLGATSGVGVDPACAGLPASAALRAKALLGRGIRCDEVRDSIDELP